MTPTRSRGHSLREDARRIDLTMERHSLSGPFELTPFETSVLLLEDRRFFWHFGVDIISVIRELLRMIRGRRFGGASTIEMQFVRTITDRKERTVTRKIREMLLAIYVQSKYSKWNILRCYLDIAYFGTRLVGARQAARHMFDLSTDALPTAPGATIAAMLVAPRPSRPNANWKRRIERRSNYAVALAGRFSIRVPRWRSPPKVS